MYLQTGALSRLMSLVTLHISTYHRVERYNLPKILGKNSALKNLYLTVSIRDFMYLINLRYLK